VTFAVAAHEAGGEDGGAVAAIGAGSGGVGGECECGHVCECLSCRVHSQRRPRPEWPQSGMTPNRPPTFPYGPSAFQAVPVRLDTVMPRAAAHLPEGTVTFLFSDIEGSTRLLKQLGRERYGEILRVHNEVLRAAFAEHRGTEIDR